MFCMDTEVTGWNSVAHVMQEGKRADRSGSLCSWDVFSRICQSESGSQAPRGRETHKQLSFVTFFFFLKCILPSRERSVAEHESYSPGQLWLSFFSFLSYALYVFQPLLQVELGFYRQLPSTSQQPQSRTLLALNETGNIGTTACHHTIRDNSNTQSVWKTPAETSVILAYSKFWKQNLNGLFHTWCEIRCAFEEQTVKQLIVLCI